MLESWARERNVNRKVTCHGHPALARGGRCPSSQRMGLSETARFQAKSRGAVWVAEWAYRLSG